MKTKNVLLILVGITLTLTVSILAYSHIAEIQPKIILIYGIIGIIAILSIFIALKKMKEEKEGQPFDDEFTTQIKHKAGFYAYIMSMYLWLFIFLFRGLFSNIETIVGFGILSSAVIGFVCKVVIKKNYL